MTKTIIVKYSITGADTRDIFTSALATLKVLNYPEPKLVKLLRHGPHKDSYLQGFEKAVIKAIF